MCCCQPRKPCCESGKRLYTKMRNRLLKRGLEMDEKHVEYWNEWYNDHVKG